MGLFSAEYRFPLLYETDRNLLGLAHTHTLQGALFADAGQVTDARNVFRFNDYQYDVGVGLRWYVDFFGVYPASIRIDIAQPVNTPLADEAGLQYYISGGQPF
jgi:outer membrane protein assembly factor BamA